MSALGSPDSRVLIDVRAVAALLGCSPRHVYRLCDAGKMPQSLKLGKLVRWRRADIEEWVADGCPPVHRYEARTPGVRR